MKASKNDFIAGQFLPRYTQSGIVPFSYKLDGVGYRGIPAEFSPEAETVKIDANIVYSVLRGRTPEGLALRAECREYIDYPVVEWVMYITNENTVNSAVISEWQVEAELPASLEGDGESVARLLHGNGDNLTEEGYSWIVDPLTAEPLAISPCGDGTPCNGAFPYMRLLLDGYDVNIAVGWTGTWQLTAQQSGATIKLASSQKNFNTYLEPGETVRTPLLVLQAAALERGTGTCFAAADEPLERGTGICSKAAKSLDTIDSGERMPDETHQDQAPVPRSDCPGFTGEQASDQAPVPRSTAGFSARSGNIWRSWYIDHVLPRQNGKPLPPKLVLHTFMIDGLPEFCGVTEENQLKGIQTYIDRGLKPDIWWIDAGWYPCNNDWPTGTGNWRPNPDHFPDGMHKVGEMAEKNGIDLLVWFEPERIFRNTEVWNEHPEFLIFGDEADNNALFFLGDPKARRWITDRIDSIIKEAHIRVYRQDFNFAPAGYWARGEAENRRGIHENLHIQGYYAFWDELLRRNPGLWIDSCASGGRRNDIETMKRAVPLHYTDIGYGKHPIKQKQHRQMFEWIPYFRAHNMSWDNPDGTYGGNRPVDEFAYQNALTPALTSMIEWNGPEEQFVVGRAFHPVWRKAAEIMLRADYYPLTETRGNASDWYAMQFYDPERGDGFVQIIRNVGVRENRITVNGFVPDENLHKIYRFNDPLSGQVWTMSGENFRSGGFEDSLNERSGRVWFYCVL